MKTKKRVWLIVTVSIIVVLAVLFGACAIYLSDYYRADNAAIGAFLPQHTIWKEESDGTVIFSPEGATKGLIFYPGGKVEHTAYIPLMQACAEAGVFCVLLEMPFNLAVFDVNAADGIREAYPEITDWSIGGHSLGGSMAASYLADHTDEYRGLVLLGSYATVDLSDTELDVLSVYGSEDGVLNRENYEENRKNLPNGFREIVIEGGCHAYFGMYGAQEGDGLPSITNAEQIRITANAIAEMMQ